MKKYSQLLGDRIAEKLIQLPNVEKKEMFGGLVFMVDDKMYIGVMKDKIMLRINPEKVATLEHKDGWTNDNENKNHGWLYLCI